MRKAAVGLVVLLVLLLLADRGAAAVAERVIAGQAQSSAALPARPEVEVLGFPFLTQALAGRYDEVRVRATDVPAGDLVLGSLLTTLTNVSVPLSQALTGSVDGVPAEGLTARAFVPYDQLAQRAGSREVTLAPMGDRLRVTGQVDVLGQTLSAVAVSRIEVLDGRLVVTAEEIEVGSGVADRLVTRALAGRLDFDVPLGGLPYGLEVSGVDVRPDGVEVRAVALDVVLR